jgi:deoxyribonuclease V
MIERPDWIKRATEAQRRLSRRCIVRQLVDTDVIRTVGAADAAYDGSHAYAATVVMALPDLEVLDTSTATMRVTLPYLPGFFAFREGPSLMAAVRGLSVRPDFVLFNGHGLAHPRRFGIASHLGVLLNIPSAGVAGQLMAGSAMPPAECPGAVSPVLIDGEMVGMAVRTREGSRPLYISPGHLTDTCQALEMVLACCRGHRWPEPLRAADSLARKERKRAG